MSTVAGSRHCMSFVPITRGCAIGTAHGWGVSRRRSKELSVDSVRLMLVANTTGRPAGAMGKSARPLSGCATDRRGTLL